MQQTLFFIPREAFGYQVFGFGLVLAVWAGISIAVLGWLVWRKGLDADAMGYFALFALVAAVVWFLLPVMCESRGLAIRGYGAMIVAAFAAGTALAVWRAHRVGLQPDLIFSLAFWLLVPGIVCARAFYVIEYWPRFRQESTGMALLGEAVNIADGGLVVYGALIGALAGLIGFTRQYKLPFLATCDVVAPSLVLGLALGRLGCIMTGCCFGGPSDVPWAITFPPDSPAHWHQVERGETFIEGIRLGVDSRGLPMVKEVEPGSPAEGQGLKPGQVIATINGREIGTVKSAAEALLHADKISVTTAGNRHVCRWTIDQPVSDSPDVGQIEAATAFAHGLKIAVNGQRRPAIAAVEPGSAAEPHGLKPGERIVAINGREVNSVAEAAYELWQADRISIRTAAPQQPDHQVRARLPLGNRPVRPIHPTQIYSAINGLVLCLLLLAYGPFCRRDGQLFALALSVYPVTRFLLEIIRTDESPVFGTGMSISQNVSLILLVCATGVWFYVLRRPPGRAFEATVDQTV